MAKLLEHRLLEQAVTLTVPTMSKREARARYASFRGRHGLSARSYRLTTEPDGNIKTNKSIIPTYSLALAPASTSGVNVCPRSTPECRRGCVAFAGKGGMPYNVQVRIVRTLLLRDESGAFMAMLMHELDAAVAKHGRINFRLNTFSDLPWETLAPWLFTRYGDAVAFYDYTKVWERVTPPNYHLTLSATERTGRRAIVAACRSGRSVAVVIGGVKRGAPMPAAFDGVPMIDADLTDDRTADRGCVAGLRPKGSLGQASPMVYSVA